MPRTRPPHPPEFREEAVRLALTSGKSPDEIAKDLGVSYESLRKWIKQHQIDGGNAPGITSIERDELRKLRRENRIHRANSEAMNCVVDIILLNGLSAVDASSEHPVAHQQRSATPSRQPAP